MKDVYIENFKILINLIKRLWINGNIFCGYGFERLILLTFYFK